MDSTTAIVIGMTWGGVEYAWTSAQVLAPLIIGGIGLLLFLLYETLWAKHPLVSTSVGVPAFPAERILQIPMTLILNRTTISGSVLGLFTYI